MYYLSVCLLPLGCDGVQLVNEDDGRRVLLRLLKSLPEVTLRLSSHLGHDLWAIDQEEEGSGLIGHRSCHQGLTGS